MFTLNSVFLLVLLIGMVTNGHYTSTTTVNGVDIESSNQLVFCDNFFPISGDSYASEDNYRYLNSTVWKREIKIAHSPDYEFCVYHTLEKGLKLENNILKIIPSLLEDEYGENITRFGRLQLADCTGTLPEECFRQATGFAILPPIISSRLSTKKNFSFRYGKIEIRAKFPEGDWLYPELWLQPINKNSTSRIIMGMARGNKNLIKPDDSSDFNSQQLEFILRVGSGNNITETKLIKRTCCLPWTEEFHIYTTIWKADGFSFQVDGQEVGHLRPDDMTPFNSEFYVSLGVGVGGTRVFPDGTKSGYYNKPWKNMGAKTMLKFWQAKDYWYPTWQSGKASLDVDYVKIWSN